MFIDVYWRLLYTYMHAYYYTITIYFYHKHVYLWIDNFNVKYNKCQVKKKSNINSFFLENFAFPFKYEFLKYIFLVLFSPHHCSYQTTPTNMCCAYTTYDDVEISLNPFNFWPLKSKPPAVCRLYSVTRNITFWESFIFVKHVNVHKKIEIFLIGFWFFFHRIGHIQFKNL